EVRGQIVHCTACQQVFRVGSPAPEEKPATPARTAPAPEEKPAPAPARPAPAPAGKSGARSRPPTPVPVVDVLEGVSVEREDSGPTLVSPQALQSAPRKVPTTPRTRNGAAPAPARATQKAPPVAKKPTRSSSSSPIVALLVVGGVVLALLLLVACGGV